MWLVFLRHFLFTAIEAALVYIIERGLENRLVHQSCLGPGTPILCKYDDILFNSKLTLSA